MNAGPLFAVSLLQGQSYISGAKPDAQAAALLSHPWNGKE